MKKVTTTAFEIKKGVMVLGIVDHRVRPEYAKFLVHTVGPCGCVGTYQWDEMRKTFALKHTELMDMFYAFSERLENGK